MTFNEAVETVKKNWPDERYTMLREALTVLINCPDKIRRGCKRQNEVLLDGMILIKESALDRLSMDDEIVSLVDYHVKRAAIMGRSEG